MVPYRYFGFDGTRADYIQHYVAARGSFCCRCGAGGLVKITAVSFAALFLFILSAAAPAPAYAYGAKQSSRPAQKTWFSERFINKIKPSKNASQDKGAGENDAKTKADKQKNASPVYDEKSAQKYYAQGLKTQDLNEQIKLFTKAVQLSPKFTAAYHRRADAYKAQGQYKKALADYSQIINLSPKDPFKYYARALVFMQQKDYSSASDDLTKAITLNKDYDDFYYQRAVCSIALEKYKSALKDIEKIKDKDEIKNNPALYDEISFMEGRVQFSLYNYDAAREIFERILSRNPEHVQALVYLGRVELNNERYDEAVSYFSKALNRDAAEENALRFRAAAYKETGQFDSALEDYTSLLAFKEDFLYYNRRGLIYEQLDAWPLAAQDYTKALELNPKWAIAFNNRGYAYMKMKDYKKAVKDFEASLKLSPLRTTYINLAGYYWTVKKDKKAMYQNLDSALKHNFKEFDILYDDAQKGWLFKNINNTVEFRSFMAPYSSAK